MKSLSGRVPLMRILPWLALTLLVGACRGSSQPLDESLSGELIIFHAGSLTLPVQELSARFEELHPNVEVLAEAAGSRTTARKVSELQREADLVMSADYQVIDTLLIPDHASWNILFARNAMVVAYTERSRFAEEINAENWYQILTRETVRVGRSNPQVDPNGYRTLMVWQLAEEYYNVPGLYQQFEEASPPKFIRPKETDLIPLLQSSDLDYAFNYLSVARQHNLNYIDLPEEINLSDPIFEDLYQTARVELDGTEPGSIILRQGEPIIYGVTVPLSAPSPALAAEFLSFLFSLEGRAIIENQGQIPLDRPLSPQWDLIPLALRDIVDPFN